MTSSHGFGSRDKLPEKWIMSRLGWEAWVRARLGWKGLKAEEYVDEGYALLATPNIKGRDIDFSNVNYISSLRYEESPEIKLRLGDVLLAKDGSTLGTVNLVRELPTPATVNSSIAVITPGPRLNGSYAYYLFQSHQMAALIEQAKGGMGVPHLFQEDLIKFQHPLPPIEEQVAIGAFLDRETGKIDALAEEQNRLIKLLKEKRDALVAHAVTKGIDPKVNLTSSGVEWLGDIPTHWEVRRLQQVCDFQPGKAHEPYFSDDGQYICVTARFISTGGVPHRFCTECITPGRRGDILMVMSDLPNGRALGRAFLVDDDGPYAVNQRVCSLTVRDGSPLFFFYQLDRNPGLLRHDDGANQTHLSNHDFLKMPVLVPPLDEQEKIAGWLLDRTERYTQLATSAEQAIGLLRERRVALISAAVTGKMDARKISSQEVAA
ncbi:restriction endonuclease subunit S [Mesorhizobium sp. CAU 1741]|uniref:restriction endonuclease subunit S n=1 Tax=Mesorhizobium sp. CAU 1741 TaxID=3140366 RepID=UPI00325BA168